MKDNNRFTFINICKLFFFLQLSKIIQYDIEKKISKEYPEQNY